jgi:NADPH-dependent 2,4-dienoyl-CoA reductase/sulfur reductase-like enzyme
VGHEFEWGGDRFTATEHPKAVLVVGGGPAGLEAARVAAERGHRVTLCEAGPELGGQFRLAGLQPRRAQITDLIAWYARQLEKLGVDVRFNSYLDADEVTAMGADVVILATGSLPPETGFQKALPQVAQLPGVDLGNVWSTEDVMGRAARLGKRIVVLDEGGHWKGIGTAWHLAEAGHEVTIVTPDAMIARDLQRSATDFSARATLTGLGVRFVTESAITGWSPQGARCASLLTGQEQTIAADMLVLAIGNRCDTTLLNNLRLLGTDVRPVGDAAAPRLAAAAIHDGRLVGLTV